MSQPTVKTSKFRKVLEYFQKHLLETRDICLSLFKIMIPVIIVVKILQEYELIQYISGAMAPIMNFVGLPGELGLVWATAMIANLYSGMVVFVALYPEMNLSIAEVTILASLMLMAHNLPIEVMVAKLAGVKVWISLTLRIGCAIIYAKITETIYHSLNWGSQPITVLWQPTLSEPTLPQWVVEQIINLAGIAGIVLALILLMDLLKVTGVINVFSSVILRPLLKFCGIGKDATMITLAGVTMGLAFGGGMILRELKHNTLNHRNVFSAMMLMSLCHAMIEDTVLMLLIGADMIGVFWLRLVFSILVVAVISRIIIKFSNASFYRYCYLKPIEKTAKG